MGEDCGTRVYVGNLGEKVKKEDLEGEFTKYGKLNSVWVAFNPPGFAFVEFEKRDEAQKACDVLNGQDVLGSSKLRVEISKSRPKPRGRPNGGRFGGSSGGRFGGSGGRFGNSGGRREGGFRGNRDGNFRSSGGGNYRSSAGGDGFRSGGRPGGFNSSSAGGYSSGRNFSRDGGGRFNSGSGSFGRSVGASSGGNGRFRSRSPRSRF